MSRRTTVRTLPDFPVFCADLLGRDLSTRTAQVAFAKAMDGLPLDARELELFRTHTGRETPRPGGYPYGLALWGRQCGKSEQAGDRLAWAGIRAVLAGQRDVACVGISQDHRAAQRVLFGYVERIFELPMFRGLVASKTADTITLRGNVKILVLPCRPAAIRGLRCVYVVLDELAHFRSTENLPLDRESWRAALPTLLTTRGTLLALTSPYIASGLPHDLHRSHFGKDTSDVLVWQAPSYVMNPVLDASALAQLRDADPEGAAAEIEGEFLRHVSALLDDEALDGAVDEGVTARRPEAGRSYHAFVDVATGTKATGDRWTCGIAHGEDGVGVLDALLIVAPPFSPADAAAQTAKLCREYAINEVVGDAFAAGFSAETFEAAGIAYRAGADAKSDIYLRFAALLQSGKVRLLDVSDLRSELRGLERRRGSARDKVDHRRGGRDDAANAACGALTLAAGEGRYELNLLFTGLDAYGPNVRQIFEDYLKETEQG